MMHMHAFKSKYTCEQLDFDQELKSYQIRTYFRYLKGYIDEAEKFYMPTLLEKQSRNGESSQPTTSHSLIIVSIVNQTMTVQH